MTQWFDDIPVAGSLSEEAISEKLGELVTTINADQGRAAQGRFGFEWLFSVPAWRHTSHSFGSLHQMPRGQGRSDT